MKRQYDPRIFVEPRRDKFALFVEMPDGKRHNVVDVWYSEIPIAIRSTARAFNLGLEAQAVVMNASKVREFDVFYVDDAVRTALTANNKETSSGEAKSVQA